MPVQTPPTANILKNIDRDAHLGREQNGKIGSFLSQTIASVPDTMAALILAYRLDPDSPYRKLRWHTRHGGLQ